MNRPFAIAGLSITTVVILVCLAKMITPLRYAEIPLREEALQHVAVIQTYDSFAATSVAQHYRYLNSDYESGLPSRIIVKETHSGPDVVIVSFYDPDVQDDSISQSVNRIHLKLAASGNWLPFRHEWSHKGRGRFGWTTKPTK